MGARRYYRSAIAELAFLIMGAILKHLFRLKNILVRVTLMISALCLAIPLSAQPEISSTTSEFDAQMKALESEIDAVVKNRLDEQDELERIQHVRMSLCRSAPYSDKYETLILEAVERDPSVGPVIEIFDRCQFYLTGKLDQLRKEKASMLE